MAMGSKGLRWLVAACAFAPAVLAQNVPAATPVPSDPLELADSSASAVDSAKRADVLQLLQRAKSNYDLRSTGQAYDLKITFTVNSGGKTEHDGAWEMEDMFDPRYGLRWTAKDSAAYAITRISNNGMLYGEETADYIPLRLQEARATLFDPIPSLEYLNRASLRTSSSTYNGAPVTCVLLSGPRSAAAENSGRRWDESEECIDPQTGFLLTHSQVPGRYAAYDYTDTLQLAGHTLPRKVVVTEGGSAVTTISAESLTGLSPAKTSLLIPTEDMKARGRATGTGGAQKISRVFRTGPLTRNTTAQTVCVFGVVTPSGQLAEAHSLQPSNPYSQAAIEIVRQMSFAGPAAPNGVQPQQHFVFVIGTFAARP
jgi:hypothetical protein